MRYLISDIHGCREQLLELLTKIHFSETDGHLVLDCGCVFGGNLAAYCLETEEITYVEGVR